MKKVYLKTFNRLGLKPKIVEASGGTFSQYSHEFQVLHSSGEDEVVYCDCGFARNKEVCDLKEVDNCPKCLASPDLAKRDKPGKVKISKAIEVGNIFKLGTKYSTPFSLKFKTKNGKEELIEMGCYGIGLGRSMGAIVEISSDEKGIIWPESIAPFKVHLIALGDKKKEAEKIYQTLQKMNIAVLFDDREDVSVGEKFADADLIGIPYRVVISDKTAKEKKVELKERKAPKAKLVKEKELLKIVGNW